MKKLKILLMSIFSMTVLVFILNLVHAESEISLSPNYVYELLGKYSDLSKEGFAWQLDFRKRLEEMAKLNHDCIITNDKPESNAVYLTFDDGPDDPTTLQIINILFENGVTGNFFFTGENIKKYPDVLEKAVENGNFVTGHTFSHVNLTTLSNESIEKEITDANNLIEEITGRKSTCFRPPYSAVDDNVISVSRKLNLKIILWSIDTFDWSTIESKYIIKNIEENLRPGDIIVMHSSPNRIETVKALPEIIKVVKDKGYKIETLNNY